MTATQVVDMKSRLPGCSGQAADAVSAKTQVNMEDESTFFKKIQSQNAQIFGYVYQNTNGPNHGPVWKIQSFLLSEICTVILWQDCYGKGNLRKFYWDTVGKTFQIGNAYSYTAKKGLFLSVFVDDLKMTENKQNTVPMWNILMKDVDLGEATSFLDHVYLGCPQRECKINKDIVDNYRSMFESRISARATEKLAETKATGKPDAETISSWSYDVEGHAKKCVERYCELANKTTQQFFKVLTPCMDDHQFKEEENASVGELSIVCPNRLEPRSNSYHSQQEHCPPPRGFLKCVDVAEMCKVIFLVCHHNLI